MKTTISQSAIGLLVVFTQPWIAGCNKNESANTNGGAATTPAAPAAATPATPSEATATGIWQVVKLEDDKGNPLTGGIFSDMLSEKLDVRPDHTYGLTNTAIGHVFGVWALNGNQLTLTPAGSFSIAITLTVEPPHLVNRQATALTTTYDNVGPSSSDTTPKFHVTASDFLDEVKKDFAAAKTKYNDARVEVTGVVTSIDNMASGPKVMVAGPPPAGKEASDLYGGLICRPVDQQPWAGVGRLQPVKASGIATLMNNAVELGEVKFALDGPSLLINMTAADLVAEYKKDPEALKKKYSYKSMIMTGTVVQKQTDSGKPKMLTLGTGDDVVYCEYSSAGSDAAKVLGPVQVGQPIKLAGDYNAYGSGKGPQLQNCNLITP